MGQLSIERERTGPIIEELWLRNFQNQWKTPNLRSENLGEYQPYDKYPQINRNPDLRKAT